MQLQRALPDIDYARMMRYRLERVREQRPVEAKPVGPVVRAVRWTQRNPLAAGGVAAGMRGEK